MAIKCGLRQMRPRIGPNAMQRLDIGPRNIRESRFAAFPVALRFFRHPKKMMGLELIRCKQLIAVRCDFLTEMSFMPMPRNGHD
jgi:hypothetical protein